MYKSRVSSRFDASVFESDRVRLLPRRPRARARLHRDRRRRVIRTAALRADNLRRHRRRVRLPQEPQSSVQTSLLVSNPRPQVRSRPALLLEAQTHQLRGVGHAATLRIPAQFHRRGSSRRRLARRDRLLASRPGWVRRRAESVRVFDRFQPFSLRLRDEKQGAVELAPPCHRPSRLERQTGQVPPSVTVCNGPAVREIGRGVFRDGSRQCDGLVGGGIPQGLRAPVQLLREPARALVFVRFRHEHDVEGVDEPLGDLREQRLCEVEPSL
mmetsp:Transcript_6029/g.24914  ORF Transcript_6029/g.24914 Transcript_6029/m.24914 type:complete len:270 (+) Transcript_6029:122-931(+)